VRFARPRARRRAVRNEAAAYLSAALPRARTPWREATWCAVDLELTGLDPRAHEIISFGAVPIEAGRVRLGGAVSALVRPAGEISAATIPIHGIRAADLEQAPALSQVIGGLLQAMKGRILVVTPLRLSAPSSGVRCELNAHGSVAQSSTRRCSDARGCASAMVSYGGESRSASLPPSSGYPPTSRTTGSATR